MRSGIPLAYRAKAWLECSGALEMREPGVFADLLAECDTGSSVVKEIEEMCVGRCPSTSSLAGRARASRSCAECSWRTAGEFQDFFPNRRMPDDIL